MDEIINKTILLLKKHLNYSPGHGLDHMLRVYNMAQYISNYEGGDKLVINIASLLHDVDDRKINIDKSVSYVDLILLELNISKEKKEHIKYIINNQSFSESIRKEKLKTLEARIVQDVDRLDAVGAIGLSRLFAYGVEKGHLIFDENIIPRIINSKEQYHNKTFKDTSISHIFEKTLILKDLINTNTAKIIANKRHKFVINFIE
jgi:uncharacterized protein